MADTRNLEKPTTPLTIEHRNQDASHLSAKPAAFASLVAMKEGVKGFFTGKRKAYHGDTHVTEHVSTTKTMYAPEVGYHNPCLDALILLLPPLAMLLGLAALACSIGGLADLDSEADEFVDVSDTGFYAVWILNIILTPIPIILAPIACCLGCLARQHEKKSYKDPVTDSAAKRHRWAYLAAPLLTLLLLSLLLLTAYFLFSSLVGHRRKSEIEQSYKIRNQQSCELDDTIITDSEACDDIGTSYEVLEFGGILGFLATLPLLLLTTAALAHACSYKKYHEKNTHLHHEREVVRESTA